MDWDSVTRARERVFDALDWRGLGEIYFHEDGEALLRERRSRLGELGESLARALLRRVPSRGASLWVGAGLVELPVLLAEVMLGGRAVTAASLRGDECELLNDALRRVTPQPELTFVAGDVRDVAGDATVDHVGCISIFTDPETWPLLSDVAYGRISPVQLDVDRFVSERAEAGDLASCLFGRLSRPGWITTSAEEVAWFLETAAAQGANYEAGEESIETAMVGDPVGFLRID